MPTRNVSLTSHLDDFVEQSVSSGQYQNASEVIRDALRLLEERKREQERKLERLRQAVAEGFAEIDRGEYVELGASEIDAYFASLRKERGTRRRQRKA